MTSRLSPIWFMSAALAVALSGCTPRDNIPAAVTTDHITAFRDHSGTIPCYIADLVLSIQSPHGEAESPSITIKQPTPGRLYLEVFGGPNVLVAAITTMPDGSWSAWLPRERTTSQDLTTPPLSGHQLHPISVLQFIATELTYGAIHPGTVSHSNKSLSITNSTNGIVTTIDDLDVDGRPTGKRLITSNGTPIAHVTYERWSNRTGMIRPERGRITLTDGTVIRFRVSSMRAVPAIGSGMQLDIPIDARKVPPAQMLEAFSSSASP